MKKYKYKLEGLVKLRDFSEEKAKIELGKVNHKIAVVEDQIAQHNLDIGEAYRSQEAILNTSTNGKLLQFYPQYISAQNNAIKHLEMAKMNLLKDRELKMQSLLKARAEAKVVNKLKEKDWQKHKKVMQKEEAEKLEENVQMWISYQKEVGE